MAVQNWRDFIIADPEICHGRPCIKGTRIMVSVVLDNLAAGESPEVIARDYHLELDDVRAALMYAGELAREQIVALPA